MNGQPRSEIFALVYVVECTLHGRATVRHFPISNARYGALRVRNQIIEPVCNGYVFPANLVSTLFGSGSIANRPVTTSGPTLVPFRNLRFAIRYLLLT